MGRGRIGSGVEVREHSLRIRFTYQGKRRCERVELEPTPANIKAAIKLAAKIRQEIALGVFDYAKTFPNSAVPKAPVPPFSEYVKTWLATLAHEKSTADGYRTTLENFWAPAFAGKRLDEITHTDVATAIAAKAKTASAKTTNNLLIPLRQLFAAAEADGHVERLPTARVHNRRHQRAEIDPFLPEEMAAILSRMEERSPRVVWAYYEFAFNTGLRPSEQIAMRWGAVDWRQNTAQIAAARVRHKVKGTKTHSVRLVDLNERAMAALQVMKAHTFLKGLNEPIFADPAGRPWTSDRKQREEFFYPVLKALGIRQRRAYNTRHTYATMALMGGVNPAYVARQLGHKDVSMLLKHYARWIDGADKGTEASKLNTIFTRNWPVIGPRIPKSQGNPG
ncbi:MAG TPA: site-specific integrase [Rhizomicrobium sp.]|nr:site-specific integrase [Rhizomicrobium sp.]